MSLNEEESVAEPELRVASNSKPTPSAAAATPTPCDVPGWSPDNMLLVTGASGLVGSHVVDWAIRNGVRVRALVQNSSEHRLLRAWGADVAFASITHPFDLKAALRSVTHVVHCAAKVADWGREEQFHDVNVKALEGFLEVARETPTVQRFVHLSSLGVHAPQDHFGTDESAPIDAERGFNAYSRSKAAGELALKQFARREKLPAVVLRPGYVYGPRDRHVIPQLLAAVQKGRLFYVGEGDQVLHNTYVGNLVDAIVLSLTSPAAVGGTFQITDGQLLTRQEFFETVAAVANCSPPQRHVSWNTAWRTATALETVWRFIGIDSPPPLTRGMVQFLGRNLEFSIKKARNVLGYNPRFEPLTSLRSTVEWCLTGGKKRK